jgi:hypothetical protein
MHLRNPKAAILTATRRSWTYHVYRVGTTPPTNGIPKEPQATPIKVIDIHRPIGWLILIE